MLTSQAPHLRHETRLAHVELAAALVDFLAGLCR